MDQENLFTSTKWPILQALSSGKKSPLELSMLCKTSIANISQQLRLLELANIVRVERIPNRDKGQPRILYSLTSNTSFLIACMDGLVEKKFLVLNPIQKATLAIWLTTEPSRHYFLERAFWNLEMHLPKMLAIYYDPKVLSSVSLTIVSDDIELKKKLSSYTIESESTSLQIQFTIKKKMEFKPSNALCLIYAKN
jgi:DNA-binding HxlR family transcriptional regulator